MSTLEEKNENVSGDIEFRWGQKRRHGAKNPKFQYYESFTYDGVDYFLYDSVYVWCEGQPLPYIAKIIEIYETPRQKKMVKLVWYFRPAEVQNWLRGVHYLNNEIFLASGEGNGVSNFNPLETICGKCNVVCTSKDERNPEASMEELKMSHHVFYRTFDVEKCRLSENFLDKIAGVEVGHFFNPKPKEDPEVTGKSNSSSNCETKSTSTVLKSRASPDTCHSKKRKPQDFEVDKQKIIEADSKSIMPEKRPKLVISNSSNSSSKFETKRTSPTVLKSRALPDTCHSKKRKPQDVEVDKQKIIEADSKSIMPEKRPKLLKSNSSNSSSKCETKSTSPMVLKSRASPNTCHSKKRKPQDVEVDKQKIIEAHSKSLMPEKRPKLDKSEWFKELPWEDRMQKAHETGSLVLLENLYRYYTSSEVEDIVLKAFNIKVSAKMIQYNAFSSPYNGQALVIFNSKDEADFAISELENRCLIVTGLRSIVGSRPSLKKPGKYQPSKYFGHITIDAMKRKQLMDMENAVSTSHHAQPNTITFDMAMEWMARQKMWELCWDALYKQQAEEITNLITPLKVLASPSKKN